MRGELAAATDVPFVDLLVDVDAWKGDVLAAVAELIDAASFTNGPEVSAFEEAFARYCSRQHCVGVASGLDALRLGLLALGIEPGDEVIVPAATFVATVEAVVQAGASPVLVDISADDYCIDVAAVAAAVTPRTRFVMPVHLYGQLASMRALMELASAHDVAVVEDACQAHGAAREGVRAGERGAAAAFSFYPTKNLGAIGDAGALVTSDAAVAGKVRALREHGQVAKYEHQFAGWTSRLDTIQALVLSRKLGLLDDWNAMRRDAAAFYLAALDGVGDLVLPPVAEHSDPVWHLFVVRTADPARLAEYLGERGVRSGRHYPDPIHLTEPYRGLAAGAGAFPVAEALCRDCLSLPLFPGITPTQLEQVVETVTAYFDRASV